MHLHYGDRTMMQFVVFASALTMIVGAIAVVISTLRGSADAILTALAGEWGAMTPIAIPARVRRVTRPVRFAPQPLRAAA